MPVVLWSMGRQDMDRGNAMQIICNEPVGRGFLLVSINSRMSGTNLQKMKLLKYIIIRMTTV